MNPYKVLGVSPSDSLKVVRARYAYLVKKYHPDVSGGDTVDKFREIKSAWEMIKEIGEPHIEEGYWHHKSLFDIEKVSK